MIILKSPAEIEKIRRACRVVAEILREIEEMIQPGISTRELDRFAEERMRKKGALPAFKGYRGYQASLCTSVNEVIVHGVPTASRFLEPGDIIGIDCGVVLDGYYGDAAKTFPVGSVDQASTDLMQHTEEALGRGIAQIKVGNRLGDVSASVQGVGDAYHYGIVRDFVGHGIGRSLHEDPQIPNVGKPDTGVRLTPGMVLAIEPMFNLGTHEVKILDDGWTAVTLDGRRSAHFEHTVALTENGAEVLTI